MMLVILFGIFLLCVTCSAQLDALSFSLNTMNYENMKVLCSLSRSGTIFGDAVSILY